MAEEKYEDGYPAMRYRPSSSPLGYDHVTVCSSDEEKALGGGWHNNPGHCLAGAEACSCNRSETAPKEVQAKRSGRALKALTSA